MPCEPIVKGGKITGFICSRGKGIEEWLRLQKCYKCGKSAIRFCDHRGGYQYVKGYRDKSGKIHFAYKVFNPDTCDKPMCDSCSNKKGYDPVYNDEIDFCDSHNNDVSIALSRKAEQAFNEYLKN